MGPPSHTGPWAFSRGPGPICVRRMPRLSYWCTEMPAAAAQVVKPIRQGWYDLRCSSQGWWSWQKDCSPRSISDAGLDMWVFVREMDCMGMELALLWYYVGEMNYMGMEIVCLSYYVTEMDCTVMGLQSECGFCAQSASEAIFRARVYSHNLFSPVMMIDCFLKETRRKPTTGRQSPSLFHKWHRIFYMPRRTDTAGHTRVFDYLVIGHLVLFSFQTEIQWCAVFSWQCTVNLIPMTFVRFANRFRGRHGWYDHVTSVHVYVLHPKRFWYQQVRPFIS